jgi:hypothetical protein
LVEALLILQDAFLGVSNARAIWQPPALDKVNNIRRKDWLAW